MSAHIDPADVIGLLATVGSIVVNAQQLQQQMLVAEQKRQAEGRTGYTDDEMATAAKLRNLAKAQAYADLAAAQAQTTPSVALAVR